MGESGVFSINLQPKPWLDTRLWESTSRSSGVSGGAERGPNAPPAPVEATKGPQATCPGGENTGSPPSVAALFDILWEAVADTLGTAATATLMRRATQRAVADWPELGELTITRDSLEHRYAVPASWNASHGPPLDALRELARELCLLLVDLTGSVVVDQLARIPLLVARRIVPARRGQP